MNVPQHLSASELDVVTNTSVPSTTDALFISPHRNDLDPNNRVSFSLTSTFTLVELPFGAQLPKMNQNEYWSASRLQGCALVCADCLTYTSPGLSFSKEPALSSIRYEFLKAD